MTSYHRPVLERETLDLLVRDRSAAYLDATLGGGGHSRALLGRLDADGSLIALDRDPEALAHNAEAFAGDPRVRLHLSPFSKLGDYCAPESLAGALFDLGVSSHQLDDRARGFSFEPGNALDMRMGPDAEATALEWLRDAPEDEISESFWKNADLERSRALARRIKDLLREEPEAGSDLLRRAVTEIYRPHDAERARLLARVFQAIRMSVNRERPEIREGLSAAVTALAKGGRVAVLSYHSVEDREVKEVFRGFERDCLCPPAFPVCQCGGNHRALRKVLRKPQEASAEEVAENPRARSAKLRVMEKV